MSYLRVFFYLAIFWMSGSAVGADDIRNTHICLENGTNQMAYISVANVINDEWVGSNRPDINFSGVGISPGKTLCNKAVFRSKRPPKFTFVIGGQGSDMQYNGFVEGWGVKTLVGPVVPSGKSSHKNGWYSGTKCGTNEMRKCRKFAIKDVVAYQGN